jgi:hypothetical protein
MTQLDNRWDKEFSPKEEKSKEETKPKRKISIKKYSGNTRVPLHESIVLGEIPKFVTLDNDRNIQFKDNIERVNDVLIPSDTIDTQNPLPFVFDSEQDFKDNLEKARNESLDSIFLKVESIYRRYVDIEDHYYTLLVADTVWTWMQDRFGTTHYNFFVGDNGSGKNSALLTFKYLGYRVFYVVSASAANYYTVMGNIEEGQVTIAEDEAGDLAEDRDKRNVFKTGYCTGGSIPKIETDGGRKQDNWLTYCQKWAAMEELPENKDIKGILDRSLILKFVTGTVPYNIKDVIRSAGDPKFEPLLNEIVRTRKLLFCYRLLHYNDPILDVQLNVKNRTEELTKPLIRLFQYSPVALKRILESLSKFMLERNEVKKNSFESKLYEVISTLLEERKLRFEAKCANDEDDQLGELTLTNRAIKEKCNEVMDGNEIPEKPGAFYSPDFGTVTQTRITRILKSKFKVTETRPDIDGKSTRCVRFDHGYLKRISSYYKIPEKIEIIKDPSSDTSTLPTLFRHVQLENESLESENIDEINNIKQEIGIKNVVVDAEIDTNYHTEKDTMCREDP